MSTTATQAIANFMNKQIAHMQSLDEKGLRPLRIWNKLLSKPRLDENGVQILDENGKPARDLICNKDGEVIDDSSYILQTSESLAKAFMKLAQSLTDTKEYCSIELLDPIQAMMNDAELESVTLNGELKYHRFNIIKAGYNDSSKSWELFTVKHKAHKTLTFSACYRTMEVPVEDDEIDI